RDGGLVTPVPDAGLELAERLDLEDRAWVVFGLGDVDERHLVVQPERGVPEAVGPGAVQFGVDGADELGVGVGLIGLGPVADDALRHGYLLISIFGTRIWTGWTAAADAGACLRPGMTSPAAAPSRASPAQAAMAGPN